MIETVVNTTEVLTDKPYGLEIQPFPRAVTTVGVSAPYHSGQILKKGILKVGVPNASYSSQTGNHLLPGIRFGAETHFCNA